MGAQLPLAASSSSSSRPIGHKGPRGEVLLHLKHSQPLTARELADLLGVSLNAVRHHLKELEAEDLVEYQRANRGVGAPVFLYRLSGAGEGLFPRRYEEALNGLLDRLVEREGRDVAVGLLQSYFGSLALRLEGELKNTSAPQRLQAVVHALSQEGYMAEGSVTDSDATLTEHNCAISAVAQRFPEICAAEARFLADVLKADVARREHILSGCTSCEYHVRFRAEEDTP
jgi:DeoR family transcriptional regulator, suf operon transcriptional repressor